MSHEAVRDRSAGPPRRGSALHHRSRQLRRRHQPATPSPCLHAALATCACAHQGDRYRGGARATGVLAVLTGEDLARDGIGNIPCLSAVTNRDQSSSVLPPHPAITRDRVRHVGDTVAMVVAETAAAARDAAELITVDYEPLPAVVETAHALDPGQPQVWEEAPGNLCFDWEIGDRAASSGNGRRRVIASASSSSTTGSSSIRWSRAAPSANTIRVRRATPCGARPRARISSATCSPRASSRSRRTVSAS